MTLLPIVGRELRVASRKRGTYWSRVMAASVALLIAFGIIAINELSRGVMRGQLGTALFQTLSWMCFIFVCAGGMFLTSDSLSEEKRDGTLGLLFLTDLRGFDVVLGKLIAHSLRGAYGLVAAFPILGLSFLLGGLSGEQFWRLALVLCNTLFFTLAIGVFISAVSREGQRAMFGTAGVCLVFLALTWLVDWAIASWDPSKFVGRLSLASPLSAFLQLQPGRSGTFWKSMGWVHAFGWFFLVAACVAAPRSWQEKAVRAPARTNHRRWPFSSPEKRAALRRRLFEGNPVRWLASHSSWKAGLTGVAFFLLLAVCPLVGWLDEWDTARQMAQFEGWLLSFLLVLAVASQAGQFFVRATQSGALELMLATPLPARAIAMGQWWALWRTFIVPALLLLALRISTQIIQMVQMWKAVNTSAGSGGVFFANNIVYQWVSLLLSIVSFLAGLLAVAWFAMWMGVITRKLNMAVLKTLLFVYILPWFVLTFAQAIGFALFAFAFRGGGGMGVSIWIPQLVGGGLGIGVDLLLFFIARKKLLLNFRETVAGAAGLGRPRRMPRAAPPPPLPPSVPGPPQTST